MRSAGAVAYVRGLGSNDHVCWVFDDRATFVERALEFLADGLRLGLRLRYVGPLAVDALTAELAPLGDVDDLLARGALSVVSLPDAYPSGTVVTPAHQVALYNDATDEAVEAGFAGFRVAADATGLVVTPEQRDAFTRYEHMVDRVMATKPFSALCGYDRGVVGEQGVAELACVHPLSADGGPSFHLFAADADRLGLTGEVDDMAGPLFRWALSRVDGAPAGEALRIDAGELDFADHRALVALDRRGQDAGVPVVLERATPTAAKVAKLLKLAHLRVEVRA